MNLLQLHAEFSASVHFVFSVEKVHSFISFISWHIVGAQCE